MQTKLTFRGGVGYAIFRAHTALSDLVAKYQAPRERRLMMMSAGFTMGSLLVAQAAFAQDGGFGGMGEEAARQADSLKESFGKVFTAGGFVGTGFGAYNWWRKGKEGENSQIKGSQIAMPIIAGAALGATGFILLRAGETIGIGASEQGQLPS